MFTYSFAIFPFWTTIGPECVTEEPLVDGSTPVPDGHMTASSIYYAAVDAPNARLNFAGAWCASAVEINSSQPNMWIQVGEQHILL